MARHSGQLPSSFLYLAFPSSPFLERLAQDSALGLEVPPRVEAPGMARDGIGF